ncbi:MAG: sugar-binding transcriptional regulator [Chloroflexi bacterium]|nr:MAG: sugar-binding transcriptional regulator [Chloroflexota bacterium]
MLSPPGVFPDLEVQLENRFSLQDVIVVEAREPDSQAAVSRELGIAAAAYLHRTIKEKDVIGISWGSTLSCMVDAIQPRLVPNAQVVQVIGGLGRPESEVHATDLCRRLARLLGCRLTLLPAQGIVDSQRVKEVILSDSHVQRALELFPRLTIAMLGIGSPTPESVLIRDGSILDREDLEEVLQKGAVGDIALRFFDLDGRPVRSEIDERVIGISLDQLTRVDRVVGVAGGPQKIQALQGALLGRLINVLITDHVTASQLLHNAP